jgi:small-conductance mechanosensitive channel
VLLALALRVGGAGAQHVASPPEPPAKVNELLQLLGDPSVRGWLDERRAALPAAGPAPQEAVDGMSHQLAGRVDAMQGHLRALLGALPSLPDGVGGALTVLSRELEEHGTWRVAVLLAGFLTLGFGTERLFWWAIRRARAHILELPLVTVHDRLRAVILRLVFATALIVVFGAGSVGAFLAFAWPPRLREIVLGYLLAALALRLVRAATMFLLAPGHRQLPNAERFRIVPMSTPSAQFWAKRIALTAGWFVFGWVTVSLLGALGLPKLHRELVAYALGLVLLALGIEIAWRRPHRHAAPSGHGWLGHGAGAWLLSLHFMLLWGLWVAGAMPFFWLAAVALALPLALGVTERSVAHILRPPGTPHAAGATPSVLAVCLERGARAVLIIGAALILADAWNVSFTMLAAQETITTRLLRGALATVVVVLLADFVWNLAKAAIDGRLAGADPASEPPDSEEAHRRARMRTLLPILRNFIFFVVAGLAVMMALAALGVDIGPLIAGAGVAGVAIGFGAQTLVRDIISGMFYLLDDAFRVGEYIQSTTYKGTVESFSLRSVKLRHHRGPLYTVPFGVLGAIQNMSRDWVIDKLNVGVAYDTDLDKVKKIVKRIGQELADDPEFHPHILEPLKMQGVEAFGDYAIQIRMKMKTRPNEQFVIRRRAYARLKQEFDANGIHFAFPTVRVASHSAELAGASAGDAAELGAAARQAFAVVKPPAA